MTIKAFKNEVQFGVLFNYSFVELNLKSPLHTASQIAKP